MYIEIYLDVVFVVNFIMDFVILLLERKISRKNIPISRIFFGALLGAFLMCVIILIPKLNYIVYLALCYFISSIIIVQFTFKPKKIMELVKLTFMLYIIAIVLGGIIFALYYYSTIGYGLSRMFNNEVFEGIDIQLLFLLLFFAIIIFGVFINIFMKVTSVSKNIYDISLCYKNQKINVNALLDTGNNLYDPITKWPVIIGEIEILKQLFEEDKYLKVQNILNNIYDVQGIESVKDILDINIRLIPYASLGNDNGMLMGLVLDKVIVNNGKEKTTNENVVIAIYNKKLSKDNSYSILLHPKLV